MRGRKPKPTKLKEKAGNPGKRKLASEPEFDALELKDLPDELHHKKLKYAREEWERVYPRLLQQKIVTEIDRTALVGYCLQYQRWRKAEHELAQSGAVQMSKYGHTVVSAHERVSRAAFDAMMKLMAEFGMTPSSRARLGAGQGGGQDPDKERFQRYLKRQ